jgi:hypothetical protein
MFAQTDIPHRPQTGMNTMRFPDSFEDDAMQRGLGERHWPEFNRGNKPE